MNSSDKDFNRKILIITFNFARAQEIKAFTEGRGRFQGLLFSGHKFFHATSIALYRAALCYVCGAHILSWDHLYLKLNIIEKVNISIVKASEGHYSTLKVRKLMKIKYGFIYVLLINKPHGFTLSKLMHYGTKLINSTKVY